MQWQEVIADKSLKDVPYKIELNEWGNIEMSPASLLLHSMLQGNLTGLLGQNLDGQVFTELVIQTINGIRVPDVACGTHAFVAAHRHELFASSAPDICVEIVSPSNHQTQIQEKIRLFIKAGAKEVWLVSETGEVSFFNAAGKLDQSTYNINIEKLLEWQHSRVRLKVMQSLFSFLRPIS